MKEYEANKNILVVEDEPAIMKIFTRVLDSLGYSVDTATNGNIAEKMLEGNEYELIVLDIKTPGLTGDQLFDGLKEKNPEQADRVIFTSGDTASSKTQSFLEAAGRPFLSKPFTPSELRVIIGKALRENTNYEGN